MTDKISNDTPINDTLKKSNKYLIMDLECNCTNKDEFPKEEMEIIEIGACLATKEGEILDTFDIFVKPTRHPIITDFCTELTSIRQVDVENAIQLDEALALFYEFIQKSKVDKWCSWGFFDKNKIHGETEWKNIAHNHEKLLNMPYLNLSQLYYQSKGLKRKVGVRKALRQNNLEFEGNQHRAIEDVKNIARLIKFIN